MRDPQLPLVFTLDQAIRAGLTRHAVSWRVAGGTWRLLRRGTYCRTDLYDGCTPPQRHLIGLLAAASLDRTAGVASHISAALTYGFVAPLEVDPTPWFTIAPDPSARTRRRSGLVRQVAPLPTAQLRRVHGLAITSPARTVADCLRHFAAEISVPIADDAVSRGLSLAEVVDVLRWQAPWPYAARGLASVALVDGRRESWLESRSAVTFHRLDIPAPDAQVTIADEVGEVVGRVDFLWAECVVGESDGTAKYVTGPSGSLAADPLAAMLREKAREDRLRDLGYEVVRWRTADVVAPSDLRTRLLRAFARADARRVLGHRVARPQPAERRIRPSGLDELAALRPGLPLVDLTPPYSSSAGEIAS